MSSDTLTLRLNPDLKASSYAEAFARDGYVRIEGLFELDVAEQIYLLLERMTPWVITLADGKGGQQILSREQLSTLADAEIQAILSEAAERAGSAFSFVRLGYHLSGALNRGEDVPQSVLADFLNSGGFQAFVAEVTGETSLPATRSEATCHRPGDFFGAIRHGRTPQTKIGFELGLTRGYRPDFGGQFLIHDAKGDIEKGFVPGYNDLILFKPDKIRSIASVAPYANAPRFAISGWLGEP